MIDSGRRIGTLASQVRCTKLPGVGGARALRRLQAQDELLAGEALAGRGPRRSSRRSCRGGRARLAGVHWNCRRACTLRRSSRARPCAPRRRSRPARGSPTAGRRRRRWRSRRRGSSGPDASRSRRAAPSQALGGEAVLAVIAIASSGMCAPRMRSCWMRSVITTSAPAIPRSSVAEARAPANSSGLGIRSPAARRCGARRRRAS